jgi:hypothetical protein
LAIRDHLELDAAIDGHCDHIDQLLHSIDEIVRLRIGPRITLTNECGCGHIPCLGCCEAPET